MGSVFKEPSKAILLGVFSNEPIEEKKILSYWVILNTFKIFNNQMDRGLIVIIGRLITDEKQQTKNLI